MQELASDIDDLYDQIIDAGKENLRNLRTQVEFALQHSEPDIRRAAIMTLGAYWTIREFGPRLLSQFLYDEDPLVRAACLNIWANYYGRHSHDFDASKLYRRFLTDENENVLVRIEAFQGLILINDLNFDPQVLEGVQGCNSVASFDSNLPLEYFEKWK